MENSYKENYKENNYKDPKFKVGDYVRISKYKNIFAKGYIRNSVLWTYLIEDLNEEEIIGTFS